MGDTFSKLQIQVKDWFKSLSSREQLMVVVGVIILTLMLLPYIYTPIFNAYVRQENRSRDTGLQVASLPSVLERYVKFEKRLQATEDHYKSIVMDQGGISYIESLIKNKAGLSSGYNIKDLPPSQFAEQYEQAPFQISFKISDYKRLIEFLDGVIHGERPLVLSNLKLRKARRGDHIAVEAVISIIRRSR